MKIRENIIQRVAVLTVIGKLMGPVESNKLHESVKNLISEGVFRIVLDLSHVNWINSIGVGSIMRCYTEMAAVHGSLHLTGLSEKVRSVFIISQLTRVFTIHENVYDAVNVLNSQ